MRADPVRSAAAAGLVGACLGAAARADTFDGRTDDLWDVAQGVVVTDHSGVVGASSIHDLFGARTSATETATTIFQDGREEGFVHFVEWRTPAPIVVNGFTVLANDDFDRSGARGFSEMRLYAKDPDTGEFELFHTYRPARNPYGEHITVTALVPTFTSEEFRAEFVQAGGPVSGGPRVREIDGPTPLDDVEGYVLPLQATAKRDAKTAEKSRLTASGFLDMGSAAPGFGTAVTFDAGGIQVANATPVAQGRSFVVGREGFLLTVTPSPIGSSRAKFKVRRTGDLDGLVEPDGDLPLGYRDSAAEVGGTVVLERGKFALRRGGEVRSPGTSLVRATAKLLGDGRDKLSMVLAMNRIETEPTEPFDLEVTFGDGWGATIRADQFVRRGRKFVLRAPVAGVRTATVDFGTGLVSVKGGTLDLGDFPEGASVVRIGLTLGADRRRVTVRLARADTSLRY
jgi:hypothetical protein